MTTSNEFSWNSFLGQISDIATAWLRNKLDVDNKVNNPIVNTETGKDIAGKPDYMPYVFIAGIFGLIMVLYLKK